LGGGFGKKKVKREKKKKDNSFNAAFDLEERDRK